MGLDLGVRLSSFRLGSRRFPPSDGQNTDKVGSQTAKPFQSVTTLSTIGNQ
jgi:hypothetical protein